MKPGTDYKGLLAQRLTRQPIWAMREFRWMLVVMVMVLGMVALYIFEIAPKLAMKELKSNAPSVNPEEATVKAASVRFDGVLTKAKDGTPLPDNSKNLEYLDEPYQALVRYVASVSSDALSKSGRNISYSMYPKNPEAVRGLTAQITGARLIDREDFRLDKPINDQEWIHRVFLFAGKNDGYIVDLMEPIPAGLVDRSQVSVDGVFLKMATYTGKNGPVQAPLLVGRVLKPYQDTSPRDPLSPAVMLGSVSVFAVLVVGWLTIKIWAKSR